MAQSNLTPSDWVNITPSDVADHNLIGFQVGGAGAVSAITSRGSTVTFTCVDGQLVPGDFRRIRATGTTASAICGARA